MKRILMAMFALMLLGGFTAPVFVGNAMADEKKAEKKDEKKGEKKDEKKGK
jgi:hypothetical protein